MLEEVSATFLAQITAIPPDVLRNLDEGGRDGIVVQCWWQHHSDTFSFFAHNPTRADHISHMHFLDSILTVLTESFRGDQTVQKYLAHIQGYLSS
ncbi:MAG TPA: hypothetical protein PKD53_19575 [Chloroflexaceae bacterium]|nr:hypothetical protein [Chloroflexaceae bacterium]